MLLRWWTNFEVLACLLSCFPRFQWYLASSLNSIYPLSPSWIQGHILETKLYWKLRKWWFLNHSTFGFVVMSLVAWWNRFQSILNPCLDKSLPQADQTSQSHVSNVLLLDVHSPGFFTLPQDLHPGPVPGWPAPRMEVLSDLLLASVPWSYACLRMSQRMEAHMSMPCLENRWVTFGGFGFGLARSQTAPLWEKILAQDSISSLLRVVNKSGKWCLHVFCGSVTAKHLDLQAPVGPPSSHAW